MPYELASIVERCDDILRRHGMQMQILCEHCATNGHPSPYVRGDNLRGSTVWKLTCPHRERVYRMTD